MAATTAASIKAIFVSPDGLAALAAALGDAGRVGDFSIRPGEFTRVTAQGGEDVVVMACGPAVCVAAKFLPAVEQLAGEPRVPVIVLDTIERGIRYRCCRVLYKAGLRSPLVRYLSNCGER